MATQTQRDDGISRDIPVTGELRRRAALPLRYVRDVDLAARFGVSRNTIWRWARSGAFPRPVRIGPSATRWALAEIEAFESTLCRGPEPGRGAP